MAYYLDTSALVKLVVSEVETAALREWLNRAPGELASSALVCTELMRAVRRYDLGLEHQAASVLEVLTLIQLTPQVLKAAGRLELVTVRSLDAIHLAAALELATDLTSLVTYDRRMAEVAQALNISVVSPGG